MLKKIYWWIYDLFYTDDFYNDLFTKPGNLTIEAKMKQSKQEKIARKRLKLEANLIKSKEHLKKFLNELEIILKTKTR